MLEGVLAGIERGHFQQAIADSAFAEQERFEHGDLVKVGVTDLIEEGDAAVNVLRISEDIERAQIERVRAVRARRDPEVARASLASLVELASTDANLVEPLVDCARALCTQGEVVGALRASFGEYIETPRY